MALKDLLKNSPLGLKGETPAQIPSAKSTSTIHYQYSINGDPKQVEKVPAPSKLDLDGKTPNKYINTIVK